MSTFINLIKEEFHYLASSYGFELKSYDGNFWEESVSYINPSQDIGIQIVNDISSDFVFIFVYRLIQKEMVSNSFPITEKSKISCFDFNDMLDEPDKMKPAHEYGGKSKYFDIQNGQRYYISEFAHRLRTHGHDLLCGDFSSFSEMEAKIKARALQLEKE